MKELGLISGNSTDENIIRKVAHCYAVLLDGGGKLEAVIGVAWCVASVGIISR